MLIFLPGILFPQIFVLLNPFLYKDIFKLLFLKKKKNNKLTLKAYLKRYNSYYEIIIKVHNPSQEL